MYKKTAGLLPAPPMRFVRAKASIDCYGLRLSA